MKPYKEIMESGKVWDAVMFGKLVGGLIKLPDCGTCSVMFGENEDGWEHVSVSPKHKYKIPTWNDMCVLKDIFFDDEEEVYQIHPKKSEYVNLSENCLHLWKPIGHELGELVEKRYEQTHQKRNEARPGPALRWHDRTLRQRHGKRKLFQTGIRIQTGIGRYRTGEVSGRME